MPSTPRVARVLLPALLVVANAACAATGKTKTSADDGAPKRPIAEIVEASNTQESIGQLLARLDLSMQRWNALQISASTPDDRNKARNLELWIQREAHARRAELVEQLETGPHQNRVVAAMALGFTREVEVQSPLLAALADRDPEIQGNALLGLWLLERADTPLDRVCELLRSSPEPTVRSNAALCLMTLTDKGARSDCTLEAARLGLLDPEPSVRSQSALVLGNVVDKDSLVSLADHLTDPVPLVAASSARALTHIGQEAPTEKGKVVRALVKALDETKGPAKREVHASLVVLAGTDHGDESKEWMEWALRLP